MQAELQKQFEAAVGSAYVLTSADQMQAYLREWRNYYAGAALAVVRPANTNEVAAVVRVCKRHMLAIVPQGGNTGLVGGAAAQSSDNHIVLSLNRMARVRELDAGNDSITVEAGCVLANVQTAAEAANRLFPLSLAAEGSCQIGGNLSTNAGGLNVLRYGNARDLCLGLEVVLADGSVLDGLSGLRKDNSGYDLKQLFIGSEGSLGIITAVTLKLFPRPRQRETLFIALEDSHAALNILQGLRRDTGDNLIACELIPRFAVELAVQHIPGCRDPFDKVYPWYLLAEAATPAQGAWLRAAVEEVLREALENALASDVVIAQNLQQADDFWRIRESIPAAQVKEGASIKHDISVPVSLIPEFLERAQRAIRNSVAGVRICAFGHVGDGNLHFNLSQPKDTDAADFMALTPELNQIVHDIVSEMGGSFSAEHGVGRLKTRQLLRYKSTEAINTMRTLKQALDPDGILNPGVILDALPPQ